MGIFSKQKNDCELEKEIKEAISHLCSDPKVKIERDFEQFDVFYISDEKRNFYVTVDSNGVNVTNTKFTFVERFSSSFISDLKKIIIQRIKADNLNFSQKVKEKKINLLSNIKKSIQTNDIQDSANR